MAKGTRNKRSSDGLKPSRDDWGHLLSVGAVVGAVLLVLILGAVLRVGPTEAGSQAAADFVAEPEEWVAHELPRADVPADPTPAPAAAVPSTGAPPPSAEPPARSGAPLVGRSSDDRTRLAASGKSWTAQLAVLCDRDRVETLVTRFGGDDRLHVLPVALDGRDCFRLCWGGYGDPERARSAPGLPSELRNLSSKPIPKRTSEVTR